MSDDKLGQCAHGYYGLCPHCYDSLRAELAELRAQVPVGFYWERTDTRTPESGLLFHGLPDRDAVMRANSDPRCPSVPHYVYARPVTPAAVPDDVAKDAERYRFLKERSPFGNRVPHIEQYPYQPKIDRSEFPHFTVVGIDEAIDAAILAAKEKGQ